jgi:hypothetical protein
MSPEKLFSICNGIAMIGWIIIVFFPFWKARDSYVMGTVVVLLSLVYTWLIFSRFEPGIIENFSTLDGVAILFSNKYLLLAGWVHYLAFDLFSGTWIVRDAQRKKINHWIAVPALLLTFMFGPVGLLLYISIRWIKTRSYLI